MDAGHKNVEALQTEEALTTDVARADAFDGALTRRRFFTGCALFVLHPRMVSPASLTVSDRTRPTGKR